MTTSYTGSQALRSQGSSISYGGLIGASASWQAVEEVEDIKRSGQKVSEIDVTNLQSAAKEFVLGLKDEGTVDISANFTAGIVQQLLFARYDDSQAAQYQITIGAALTTPVTFTFNAYVTKCAIDDAKVDAKIALSATLRITGGVTINYGSLSSQTV